MGKEGRGQREKGSEGKGKAEEKEAICDCRCSVPKPWGIRRAKQGEQVSKSAVKGEEQSLGGDEWCPAKPASCSEDCHTPSGHGLGDPSFIMLGPG
jgi:hypothetical protein